MPYHQLYYHFVWATKYRKPLLTDTVEPKVYDLIRRKADELGAKTFALNGLVDHVHLVVALPPSLAPAVFAGQVKGASSCQFNKWFPELPFFKWQRDYSVFSFSKRELSRHIRYVQNQKKSRV